SAAKPRGEMAPWTQPTRFSEPSDESKANSSRSASCPSGSPNSSYGNPGSKADGQPLRQPSLTFSRELMGSDVSGCERKPARSVSAIERNTKQGRSHQFKRRQTCLVHHT